MLKWLLLALTVAVASAHVIQKEGVVKNLEPGVQHAGIIDSLSFSAEGLAKRSLDNSSSESDSVEDEGFKTGGTSKLVKRSLKNGGLMHTGSSLVKRSLGEKRPERSLGVMENAGVGAVSAAVSTFSKAITSANVASGQAATGGREYPQYDDYDYPQYPNYPYPRRVRPRYPSRVDRLNSNVNNINLMDGY